MVVDPDGLPKDLSAANAWASAVRQQPAVKPFVRHLFLAADRPSSSGINGALKAQPRSSRSHYSRSVSTNRERLIQRQYEVVESSALLRGELLGYEKAMIKIAKRLERGDPASTAGRGTGVPAQRRQVTEAIEQFEAARHQLRIALFALGMEEGASIAEIGRVLGISRQLASRIASEAERN